MKTLKAPSDFRRVAASGKKWVSPAFILQLAKGEEEGAFRIGFTVSRKVGNAVTRNRAKRRLREIVRLSLDKLAPVDIVLIARPAAAEQDFARMKEEFLKGMKVLGGLA